ncbi:MAG: hypothetical protein HYR71_04990, partial [Chloroflexi bacterium]|nr:hypothetical protein [Chloroflexota bacterium]
MVASLCWVAGLALLASPSTITPADSFDVRLSTVASQGRFDMVAWIGGAMLGKMQDRLGGDVARLDEAGRDALVKRYFQLAREEEELRAK